MILLAPKAFQCLWPAPVQSKHHATDEPVYGAMFEVGQGARYCDTPTASLRLNRYFLATCFVLLFRLTVAAAGADTQALGQGGRYCGMAAEPLS